MLSYRLTLAVLYQGCESLLIRVLKGPVLLSLSIIIWKHLLSTIVLEELIVLSVVCLHEILLLGLAHLVHQKGLTVALGWHLSTII